jgi:hypothetical protein
MRRLTTVPGVGGLTAHAIVRAIGAGKQFHSARFRRLGAGSGLGHADLSSRLSARRNAGHPIRASHRGQRSLDRSNRPDHDRSRPNAARAKFPLTNGGRPYMTIRLE